MMPRGKTESWELCAHSKPHDNPQITGWGINLLMTELGDYESYAAKTTPTRPNQAITGLGETCVGPGTHT